ncbi:MAG: endolytic transglycosylase MltG [Fimbriimonadaceae bacterium]|nr:MAG: putative aminodeoxychorismate lyase [Armatimonadetes bacterium OLB18]WKZ81200.1 MAG: endolytic transglycosylase MltG [Fimbriimonadaceae bacterium]
MGNKPARSSGTRLGRVVGGACLLVAAALALAGLWFRGQLQPLPAGDEFYFRVETPKGLREAMYELSSRGVVRNANVWFRYGQAVNAPRTIGEGTYEIRPGMSPKELYKALTVPVRRMVRIPETNWASRTGRLLEQQGVCTAEEYAAAIREPIRYQDKVGFRLPEGGTLEGYLYPDTYDLPPLLGAEGVVLRQLRAFEDRVIRKKPLPDDLHRALIVASLIELEVARDDERPLVAGVIENRLRIGMRLQIDATVLYALDEWKNLSRKEIQDTDSPYNTYRYGGLPPGPICSPTAKSVDAALNPSEHDYLYYVALPDGSHLFSATYAEHLANIAKRKRALAAEEGGP